VGLLGALRQEIIRHLALDMLEARRPADHTHIVIIAFTVDIATCGNETLHHSEMTLCRRPVQGIGFVELVALIHVEAALEEQVHAIEMAATGGEVQKRPGGREDLTIQAHLVDMGLECAPAGKAIVARHGELSFMQLGSGFRDAQLLELLLGGLLQPFDIGLRGKRFGHGTPSFE
jgi:hypothetical protein